MPRPHLSRALAPLCAAALLSTLALTACQSDAPLAPDPADQASQAIGATRPLITLAQGGMVAGTSAMGVYRLTIAGDVATLEPANRSAALTGAKFETDLTAAMNGEILTLCPDCFRVNGISPTGPTEIAVEFVVRHPIPAPDGVSPIGTVKNRNDLVVNNVRLVVLADGDTTMFAASGPDTVVVNADLVTNADGYTKVAPVVDVPGTTAANVFPFITMGDADAANNGQGNFAPGAGDGAGWDDVLNGDPDISPNYPKGFNALPQGGSVTDTVNFDLGSGSLTNFSTDLILLASYIGAADAKPTRLTSKYFMPEGAIQQSPNVTTAVTAPGISDSGSVDVSAVDFQQLAAVDSDPVGALTAKNYSAIWAEGRMQSMQVHIGEYVGGTNNFMPDPGSQPAVLTLSDIDAAPGLASYAQPKVLNAVITNPEGLTGTFRGGVKIVDSRQGAAILDLAAAVADPLNPNVFSSITGLKEDLNVFNPASVVAPMELATYQFFSFTVGGGAATGIPVVSGMIGRANPNFPNALYRNGIAKRGNEVYTCFHWQGDDDFALFVVRSADGGLTWGTPVRVPADAIANTDFETSTSGWSIMTATAPTTYPILVGIDTDEDCVLLVGEPTGINSTNWPTGPNHRLEFRPQGTGRNFSLSVSEDRNLNGQAWIVVNCRETDPDTVNQVLFYKANMFDGNQPPVVTLVTSANGGVIDDGPDGTSSRFDADIYTDNLQVSHIVWKDSGDSYLEYRKWDNPTTTLGPIERPLNALTISGNNQPNIAVVDGLPYVVFVGIGNEVIGDAETVDRDVWLVRRDAGGWSSPIMVNTDDLDLNETDPDLSHINLGDGQRVGIAYEAANASGKRSIQFAAFLTSDLTDVYRQSLTPDATGIIDRLDPKVAGSSSGMVIIWESKGEGIPIQGATI